MYTIYVALDSQGEAKFVGRTQRLERRAEEFRSRWDVTLEAVVQIDDRQKARVVEQFVLNEVRAGRSWHLEDLRKRGS